MPNLFYAALMSAVFWVASYNIGCEVGQALVSVIRCFLFVNPGQHFKGNLVLVPGDQGTGY